MNRLPMEVPIFLKLRMLWYGPLRNLATQPVSWPVKIETALIIPIMLITVTLEGALNTLLLTEIELFQLPFTDNNSDFR
jgi:hypothetical protein